MEASSTPCSDNSPKNDPTNTSPCSHDLTPARLTTSRHQPSGQKNSKGRSVRISPDGVEVTPHFQYRRQPATKPGAKHSVMLKKLEAAFKRIEILEKRVTALQKKPVGNK